ncbi:MAG: dockerin type I repeat-containing protein [Ruminococcus sp.]|nr:dockerin type I repeat-containing protein [Ruminococcus sp.]
MKKRILSLLLTLVMILGMIPATAMTASAADFDPDEEFAEGGATDGNGHYVMKDKPYCWIDRVDFSSENFSGSQWEIPLLSGSVWAHPAVTNISATAYVASKFYSLNLSDEHYLIVPSYISRRAEITQSVRLVNCLTKEQVPSNYGQFGYDINELPDGVYIKRYSVNFDEIDDLEFGCNSITTSVTLDGKTLAQSDETCVPNTFYINKGGSIYSSYDVYPNTFYNAIYAYDERMYVGEAKPEIHSVSVNGTSVADGATYNSNSKNVTIKTTYDSVLSDALTDYGCTVKKYGRWYLNGEKINVAAVTPVDNGDGTSSETFYRTLNDGDVLEIRNWLEVKWPDGSTDIVDEHTMTISAKTPKFTTQPQGGTIVYNQRHIAKWATNFTPVKQELVRYNPTGNVLQVLEISAGASLASLSYMADGYYYRIRSYYDYYSNAYVESDKFYVTTDPYFTPNYEYGNTEGDIIAGITYVPNGDGTFNANVHVDLNCVDGQMLQREWYGTGYYWYDHNNKLDYGIGTIDTSKLVFTLYNLGDNLVPGKEWKVKIYLAYDAYCDDEWREVNFPYVTDTVPELKPEDVVSGESYIVGDVDGDGKVSIMDATVIQRHIAQLESIKEDRLPYADTDKDGKVSIIDATMIQRLIAQLITEF